MDLNSIATRLVLCGAASVQVTHSLDDEPVCRSGRQHNKWYFNTVSCSGEGADLVNSHCVWCYLGRLRSKSRTLWTMNQYLRSGRRLLVVFQ